MKSLIDNPYLYTRHCREYNLKIQAEHSPLTVGALDDLIRTTITSNQRLGPNAVRARLFAQGHRVQRWRVRESMLRVDPGGAALRAAPAMQRRTYTVAGPNSIWHIDGNHKLIRWKMVIHGGIDGFSRMMVFLHASANDRKEAVLEHFLAATTLYGVPSRIRVDHGGENNDICDIMELIRVPGRGSAIRGRSVHNQRIERSWVDLWNGATNLYYDLFHFMEQRGSLDSDNIAQLWALHYVFLPRFNKELQLFRDQWNNHGLRTAHHETSLQLFVGGTLDLSNARLTAMQDMFASSVDNGAAAQSVFENQGWDGDYVIQVPEIPCPLDQEALSQLQQTVDPLAESDELGIDIYLTVMDFISEYSLNDQP
ncbi:uncharacterized protein [Apostichopus japonicus]|uniref:uncharacterized protein isoform X2 n=1 Tax=Stichopus japonicus TaxID=307972 RepID=UPI003AB27FDE